MINQNIRLYTKQFDVKKINKKEFINKETSNITIKHSNKYFETFKAQLKNSERYLKCLSYNYRSESKALYANIKYLFYEEVKTRLTNNKRNVIKKN